ncbi:MAG: hypothetical protein C0469_01920 [Cyanobacteria bacterium DS2.3.42]|nr:hypothetical protein [Cyanobacteria bacterium DS2.3.42]
MLVELYCLNTNNQRKKFKCLKISFKNLDLTLTSRKLPSAFYDEKRSFFVMMHRPKKPIKWQFLSFTNRVLKLTILTEPHWRQNASRTFMTKNYHFSS